MTQIYFLQCFFYKKINVFLVLSLNIRFVLELNFIIFLVLPFIRLSRSDGLVVRFDGFTRFCWCFFVVICSAGWFFIQFHSSMLGLLEIRLQKFFKSVFYIIILKSLLRLWVSHLKIEFYVLYFEQFFFLCKSWLSGFFF